MVKSPTTNAWTMTADATSISAVTAWKVGDAALDERRALRAARRRPTR